MSKEFNSFCDAHGIYRELAPPYTPEQNGMVECKNRTVVEMTRSMLKNKGLTNSLLAEPVDTTMYLMNLSIKIVMNEIPFESWNGFTPSVSHLRVFGSICYA